MNIITQEKQKGRLEDGVDTLLNLDEETFAKVLERLEPISRVYIESIRFFYTTDKCESPQNKIQLGMERGSDNRGNSISRLYYSEEQYSMRTILEFLQRFQDEFEKSSEPYKRIQKILELRDLNSFKQMFIKGDGSNKKTLEKVFEILSDEDTFEKFMDFDNNTQEFSEDGKEIPKREYIRYLYEIFGDKDQDGNLRDDNHISKSFYILDIDKYKQRYSKIYDSVNMERNINPNYEFRNSKTAETIIRRGEEPSWTIHPEVYERVYSDMPEDSSLEEKAMWIYSKLCQIFLYDQGYMYRDKLKKVNYSSEFSKEHLESLRPGSKVTCFDLARLFAKLVNELEGDIEAVIIAQGKSQEHFKAGFYTQRVSAEIDPVNVEEGINDLMRAKAGIKLAGIKSISDPKGILKKAVSTIYSQVLGKEPLSIEEFKDEVAKERLRKDREREKTGINDLVQELREMPREEKPKDFKIQLETFLEIMREKRILGNEFSQTLAELRKANFLGFELDCAYLGKIEKQEDGQKIYKRKILLRQKKEASSIEAAKKMSLYLIDSDSLQLTVCSDEEIVRKLNDGEYSYEDNNRKMPGLEVKE